MGKLINIIMILVFIDIIFLVTGQLNVNSGSSLIINSILDPTTINVQNFWQTIIGKNGLQTLLITGGAFVGALVTATNVLVFTFVALGLALLIGDFMTIYNTLAPLNPVLAIMVMAPLMIYFTFLILEWLRVKD